MASKEMPVGLLCKLGSLIIHADEFMSPGGHDIDKQAFRAQIEDPEVQTWIAEMQFASLLPVKRNA